MDDDSEGGKPINKQMMKGTLRRIEHKNDNYHQETLNKDGSGEDESSKVSDSKHKSIDDMLGIGVAAWIAVELNRDRDANNEEFHIEIYSREVKMNLQVDEEDGNNGNSSSSARDSLGNKELIVSHKVSNLVQYEKTNENSIQFINSVKENEHDDEKKMRTIMTFESKEECQILWTKIENHLEKLKALSPEKISIKNRKSKKVLPREQRVMKVSIKRTHRSKVYRLNERNGKWNDHGIGYAYFGYLDYLQQQGVCVISEEALAKANLSFSDGDTMIESDKPVPVETLIECGVDNEIEFSLNNNSIITWTDPQSKQKLAISFENAEGCDDILNKIHDYQDIKRKELAPIPVDPDSAVSATDLDIDMTRAVLSSSTPGKQLHVARLSDARASFDSTQEYISELPPASIKNLPKILQFLLNVTPTTKNKVIDQILQPPSQEKQRDRKVIRYNSMDESARESSGIDRKRDRDNSNNDATASDDNKKRKIYKSDGERDYNLSNNGENASKREGLSSDNNKYEAKSYFELLLETVRDLEDLESEDDLKILFEIVRTISLFDDTRIFELMIEKNIFDHLVSIFEWDPDVSKPNHQEKINRIIFKEIVPIKEKKIVDLIHLRFRLSYLKDVLLPRILDDSSFKKMDLIDNSYSVQIVTFFQKDPEYLKSVLSIMRDKESSQQAVESACSFLAELTGLSQKLSLYQKLTFHRYLVESDADFFSLMEQLLASENSSVKLRLDVEEILAFSLQIEPTMMRNYILDVGKSSSGGMNGMTQEYNEDEGEENTAALFSHIKRTDTAESDKRNNIFSEIIKRLASDKEPGVQGRAYEILRMLLDPEKMQGEKEKFLALFYDYYITQLIKPLDQMAATPEKTEIKMSTIKTKGESSKSKEPVFGLFLTPSLQTDMNAQVRHHQQNDNQQLQQQEESSDKPSETLRVASHLICELLSFFVQTHTFRIRNFVARSNVIRKIMVLLKSNEKYLVLDAIRFIRVCVGTKDDFFCQYFISNQVFGSIIDTFKKYGTKNNLINSAIIELLNFIKNEKIKSLIRHIVEKYEDALQTIDSASVFSELKDVYDRIVVCGSIGPNKDGLNALYQTSFLGEHQKSESKASFFGESRAIRDDDDESFFLDNDLTINQDILDGKDKLDYEQNIPNDNDMLVDDVIALKRSPEIHQMDSFQNVAKDLPPLPATDDAEDNRLSLASRSEPKMMKKKSKPSITLPSITLTFQNQDSIESADSQ